eukprot:1005080-Pyramimonas_sp.AAC.1
MQEAQVYPHGGPIRCRKRWYILTGQCCRYPSRYATELTTRAMRNSAREYGDICKGGGRGGVWLRCVYSESELIGRLYPPVSLNSAH